MSNSENELTIDGIRDVWQHNLEEEFKTLRKIIYDFPFIAMDTEFPGVVWSPPDPCKDKRSYYNYQSIKFNVDLLKIIQIGFTLSDQYGNLAKPISTWQFNFKFDLNADLYSEPSIDLLIRSGIQFEKHQTDGIDTRHFAELLISSGLVLLDDVRWVTFHSAYDFGYLLKVLTCKPLPDDAAEFYQLLRLFFVHFYDIKHLMQSCNLFRGGLQELADQLEVKRIGPQHQAGSDSRLTGAIFFKMKELHFENCLDGIMEEGLLFGIENDNAVDQK
ncbi:hypothetical protein HELRODRAFT_111155 [Helobdella robusta]|uniref:poly(A)-specific ribonuclease n=1 Tax=Helobdella robusta TaxID=6412 RepID=T1EF89_HELRO|nr:hypothetical protein HELRODRAFT_111155 [Helobdella robusta]ESO05757.1 hypothetical protein HELRODRAFT_111155 [Helobdella robusta]